MSIPVSIEIVPPSSPDKISAYQEMLAGLPALHPTTVAVTLGAGQTPTNKAASMQTLDVIENQLHLPAVAHLPGLYETKASVQQMVQQLKTMRVSRIMALRGTLQGNQPVGDFLHALDLIEYLQQLGGFDISVAGYPAKHPEAPSLAVDLDYLKLKVTAGAQQVISQIFFANDVFYHFVQQARTIGIQVPIIAGVLPITSLHLMKNLTQNLHIPVTPAVQAIIDQYADDPVAFRQAGLAFTRHQIEDLKQHEVDGIHIFSMNDLTATRTVLGL